ncbi:MAG: hypothetical protein ACRD9L_04555 [Bryobacteraceae bacterium]
MFYRHMIRFGWAIAWRQFWWTLVVLLPPMFVVAIIDRSVRTAHAREPVVRVILILLPVVLSLCVILPKSIQEAVLASHANFRVSVVRPEHSEEEGRGPFGKCGTTRLTYIESLQASLLASAIYVGLGWVCLSVASGRGVLALIQIPLQLLVVYPAIAAALVHMRFRGFRIFFAPNSASAERRAS